MSLKLTKKPYTERWQKVERIFSENYGRIYICKSKDDSDNGKPESEYILKIFDNRLYGNNDVTDTRTIAMNYELGLRDLAPKVIDCGYFDNAPLEEGGDYESESSEYSDSSDFTSDSETESTSESSESMSGSETESETESETMERIPKSKHIYYMVLPKYQIDGDKYLMAISMDSDLSQNQKDELYLGYLTQVFDLYKKLADRGVCSYDAKNRNIVLNFEIDTYKILEIKLIDVDFDICKTFSDTDAAQLCYAAMLLMHFITSKADGEDDYFSRAYRKFYMGLISDKLLNYRKYDILDSKISFKKLFYCYYKNMNFDDYDDLDTEKQDKLYKSAFKHTAKNFEV